MRVLIRSLSLCQADQQQIQQSLNRPQPLDGQFTVSPCFPPIPVSNENDLHSFLSTCLSSASSPTLTTILLRYETSLRRHNIRTLSSLLDDTISDETLHTCFPNQLYFRKITEAIVRRREQQPEWYDLAPLQSLTSSSLNWRIAQIDVIIGRLYIMKITVTWSFILQNTQTRQYHCSEVNLSVPDMGVTQSYNIEGCRKQRIILKDNEYITEFSGTTEEGIGLYTRVNFKTNQKRVLKCKTQATNLPRSGNISRPVKFKAPKSCNNVAFGILGFRIGYRMSSMTGFAGVSNIVGVVYKLGENQYFRVLPSERELLHVPVNIGNNVSVGGGGGGNDDVVGVRRRINSLTGEYEEDEGDAVEELEEDVSALVVSEERERGESDATEMCVMSEMSEMSVFSDDIEIDLTSSNLVTPPQTPQTPSPTSRTAPSKINFALIDPTTTLTCPITHTTFTRPSLSHDGHTYEKTEITRWYTKSNRSPLSGLHLINKNLIENVVVKDLINITCGPGVKLSEYEIKSLLTCPLSHALFVDPVVLTGDGRTYERSFIEAYLTRFKDENKIVDETHKKLKTLWSSISISLPSVMRQSHLTSHSPSDGINTTGSESDLDFGNVRILCKRDVKSPVTGQKLKGCSATSTVLIDNWAIKGYLSAFVAAVETDDEDEAERMRSLRLEERDTLEKLGLGLVEVKSGGVGIIRAMSLDGYPGGSGERSWWWGVGSRE